jgi:hypothetical protein
VIYRPLPDVLLLKLAPDVDPSVEASSLPLVSEGSLSLLPLLGLLSASDEAGLLLSGWLLVLTVAADTFVSVRTEEARLVSLAANCLLSSSSDSADKAAGAALWVFVRSRSSAGVKDCRPSSMASDICCREESSDSRMELVKISASKVF